MGDRSGAADQDIRLESSDVAQPASDPLAAPSLREAFLRDGYVILRDAVPAETCRRAVEAFEAEVKPDRGFFLRHASGRYERHVFTPDDFMKYPIMNIQDVDPSRFAGFRKHGLDVLTSDAIKRATVEIFGEPGRIVHTMFFDGNQKTWAHRDSHYIDSETVGAMVGVWVAAEDIHPGAGRFYVYAGSNRVATPGLDAMEPNSQAYKEATASWAERSGLALIAPVLKRGDAILWSSLTIHGSLETTEPAKSRKSFTAHYIPESHAFLWLRRDRGSNREIEVNGTRVARHRDQGHWLVKAKAVLEEYLRTRHPTVFRGAESLRAATAPLRRGSRALRAAMRRRQER